MVYGSIVSAIFIVAFAYIILALANKESGNMKLTGQIIAVLVVLVAALVIFCGATGRGRHMMGKGMTEGKCPCCEMSEKGKECQTMMQDAVKGKVMMNKGMVRKGMMK